MPVHHSRHVRERFPVRAARDLLGIVRALYRAEKRGAGDPMKLQQLVDIGERLNVAIDLAKRVPPGTVGHSAAWSHANQAIAELASLVGDEARLEPVVAAAAEKVRTGR